MIREYENSDILKGCAYMMQKISRSFDLSSYITVHMEIENWFLTKKICRSIGTSADAYGLHEMSLFDSAIQPLLVLMGLH